MNGTGFGFFRSLFSKKRLPAKNTKKSYRGITDSGREAGLPAKESVLATAMARVMGTGRELLLGADERGMVTWRFFTAAFDTVGGAAVSLTDEDSAPGDISLESGATVIESGIRPSRVALPVAVFVGIRRYFTVSFVFSAKILFPRFFETNITGIPEKGSVRVFPESTAAGKRYVLLPIRSVTSQ